MLDNNNNNDWVFDQDDDLPTLDDEQVTSTGQKSKDEPKPKPADKEASAAASDKEADDKPQQQADAKESDKKTAQTAKSADKPADKPADKKELEADAPQKDEGEKRPTAASDSSNAAANDIADDIDLAEDLAPKKEVPTHKITDPQVEAPKATPPKRGKNKPTPAQPAEASEQTIKPEVQPEPVQTGSGTTIPAPGAQVPPARNVRPEIPAHLADRPEHERFYIMALEVLKTSEDLGVDSLARARIKELVDDSSLIPQLAVRDLVNERLIDRQQLARAIARSHGRREILTIQDLPEGAKALQKELDTRALAMLRERRVIPIQRRVDDRGTNELHLAHESSMRDLVLESALSEVLPGHQYFWHYASRDVVGQYWLGGEEGTGGVDEAMEAEALLERIITTAIDAKSSDVHVDPSMKNDNKATIKYRIDGMVRPKEVISLEQLDRLRVRIENIARMPKVNLSHPNKGAFSRGGFDWRVQMQPHAGRSGPVPRIVIRRLNPDSMSLESLGYPETFIKKIKAAATASNGVIFWTGPTGSGKTESIHSAVISVDPMGRGLSVHTIEDPPEKRVEGYAVQMEIAEGDDARSGLQLLKSSLRADPDVIIFGEVRDGEMAKLVFEAANTGHLVFTTLHTNTSIDAVVRLNELGIRGFLVSYVRGIAAQRLARRLCTYCSTPMKEPDEWTKFCFDFYGEGDMLKGAKLRTANPEGCPNCSYTGYSGRIAIAEWLVPNKPIIDASAAGKFEKLEELAVEAGWRPMGVMGLDHVTNGITDCEELGRVVLELSTQLRDQEKEKSLQASKKE